MRERQQPTEDEIQQELEEIENSDWCTSDDGGETRSVHLGEPVVYKGKTYDVLTFRRPKGKDWLAMDQEKGDMGQAMRLAASLSGTPFAVFREMNTDDIEKCVRVAGVMGKKLQTGGN